MDDLSFGKRNKRGDWAPNEPASIAPIWDAPPQPMKAARRRLHICGAMVP